MCNEDEELSFLDWIALLMMAVGAVVSARQAPGNHAENTFLSTYYPLDEPRGYCTDIGGTGPSANLTARLQMHTCKYGRSAQDQWDQSFMPMRDGSGRIVANHYDRCLAASAASAGAELFLQPCSDSSLQRWNMAPRALITATTRHGGPRRRRWVT
jgi:hypothetical protein